MTAGEKIAELIRGYPHFTSQEVAGQILALPEIAVVDRKAAFPDVNDIPYRCRNFVLQYQGQLDRGGWVKEVEK